jgi:lactate permease
MYQQTYDPLGNVFLSTLVAAIPILTLLYFIALHRHRDSDGTVRLGIPAPWAALFGVIAAFVIVCLVFRMPVPAAVSAFALGSAC